MGFEWWRQLLSWTWCSDLRGNKNILTFTRVRNLCFVNPEFKIKLNWFQGFRKLTNKKFQNVCILIAWKSKLEGFQISASWYKSSYEQKLFNNVNKISQDNKNCQIEKNAIFLDTLYQNFLMVLCFRFNECFYTLAGSS